MAKDEKEQPKKRGLFKKATKAAKDATKTTGRLSGDKVVEKRGRLGRDRVVKNFEGRKRREPNQHGV